MGEESGQFRLYVVQKSEVGDKVFVGLPRCQVVRDGDFGEQHADEKRQQDGGCVCRYDTPDALLGVFPDIVRTYVAVHDEESGDDEKGFHSSAARYEPELFGAGQGTEMHDDQ